jgi:hypothetical protein
MNDPIPLCKTIVRPIGEAVEEDLFWWLEDAGKKKIKFTLGFAGGENKQITKAGSI